MAKPLRPKRGTTAKNDAFTGLASEITVDTEKHSIRVHDGVTAGGHEILPKSENDKAYQPKGNYLTSAPVTSVNGKTGAVTGIVTSVNGTNADASGNVTLSGLVPIGTVIAFAGNSAPEGYLLCNGGAVSRTTYAGLFAKIGTTYGSGDGSGTFNLPNLTDKFIQGSGTAGTEKSAGLPNIEGNIYSIVAGTDDQNSGALSQAKVDTATTPSYGTARNLVRVSFDASKSNSIYGNSTTVQPPALTMRMYIKY